MTHSNRPLQATLTLLNTRALIYGVIACSFAPSDQTVHQISDKPATPEQRVAEQPHGASAGAARRFLHFTFASPDEAVVMLVKACDTKDHDALTKIFGPAAKDYVSGDPVADANDFTEFTDATAESAQLEEKNPTTNILHIGKNNWSFPIPIAKTNDGKWYFDTVAGEIEVLARRIGENEYSRHRRLPHLRGRPSANTPPPITTATSNT